MIDPVALRSELLTDPLAFGYAPLIATGNDGAIAGLLNDRSKGRFRIVTPTMINARSLMANVGATVGATILDKLDASKAGNPALRWAFSFITSAEGIDVGHPQTRAMLDQLATATVLTSAERDAVKALASFPCSRAEELFGSVVHVDDVVKARN